MRPIIQKKFDFASNDYTFISYIEILETDTKSIEMHRIKCALVESRNKFKLLKRILFSLKRYLTFGPEICVCLRPP